MIKLPAMSLELTNLSAKALASSREGELIITWQYSVFAKLMDYLTG
jgi:hypothetical protein